MLKSILTTSFFLALLLLFGCQLTPSYCPPEFDLPVAWKAEPAPSSEPPLCGPWWELFCDPLLNELEGAAVVNNADLQAACARVAEARALAGVQKADLFPQLSLTPGYSNASQLFEFFGPTSLLQQFLNTSKRIFRIHQLWYSLPFNVSYEVDIWGKLRKRAEAACTAAEAQYWAFQAATLSLTSEVAITYFSLRALDSRIDLYRKRVAEYRTAYQLSSDRYERGLIEYIDVMDRLQTLSTAEANLAELEQERGLYENLIAQLVGISASVFCIPHTPLPCEPPPSIPAGLPSTLLFQRPDIAEAERLLASGTAQVGSAYASLFPSIELTTTAGFLSPTLSEFMNWIGRYLIYGITGNQTVFDGGRKGANVMVQGARLCEAKADYRETVLTAFREVEDALLSLQQEAIQYEGLVEAATAAQTSTDLAHQRYQRGLTNYFEVVERENLSLEAEDLVVELQGLRYLSTIQLIKALGGGWS